MGEDYLEDFTDLLGYYRKEMFNILPIPKVPRVKRKKCYNYWKYRQ